MSEPIMFNVANEFHNYGFHRNEGGFPGMKLREILSQLKNQNPGKKLTIDLSGMKAFYASFADGAFGLFIDEEKERFFDTFSFSGKTEYIETVNRVFERHKALGFNKDAANR